MRRCSSSNRFDSAPSITSGSRRFVPIATQKSPADWMRPSLHLRYVVLVATARCLRTPLSWRANATPVRLTMSC